jgi:magnesium transporter
MRLRLRRPFDLARTLRAAARRRPEQVEEYLDKHAEEWTALVEAAPEDAADILEELGSDAAGDLLAELEPQEAAELLEELRPDLATEILEDLNADEAAVLLEEMGPESAVDLLSELEEERIAELLERMDSEVAEEVRRLLAYPADSAGGLMITDIGRLPTGLTAGEAIERIRQLHEELEDLSYVYVVNDLGHLAGVVSFRDLVFKRPGAGLDEVMLHSPVSVYPETDREEVAELIQRYHLFGIPVVDHEGALLGMVTTDSVIEAVQQEASEDFAAAMGAGAEETAYSPVGLSIRSRLPWNVFDVFLSAGVVLAVSRFTDIIEAFTVLAALMPLIGRVGGNTGAQSLAVVIRSLASDDIPSGEVWGVLRRQVAIGAVTGVSIGLLSGVVGFAMQTLTGGEQPLKIGVVMAVAAMANLLLAGFIGTAIPLVLRRLGTDPALASNIFLTFTADLLGFAGFLAVATLLLA